MAAGGASAAAPMPVIGFLNGTSPSGYGHFLSAFRQGLSEVGYVEAETWRSNIVGRKGDMINYRRWRLIWFVVVWQ
jgi:hypothetical protein